MTVDLFVSLLTFISSKSLKLDILYAYETVISAGLAMNVTIVREQWPQSKTLTSTGTGRYTSFMETVKQVLDYRFVVIIARVVGLSLLLLFLLLF